MVSVSFWLLVGNHFLGNNNKKIETIKIKIKFTKQMAQAKSTTSSAADANNLDAEALKTPGFYRGFFTQRQQLPSINARQQSYAGTAVISAINCAIFYFIFRGRMGVRGAGGAAASASASAGGKEGANKGIFAQAFESARKMGDPLSGKKFRVEHKGTNFKDIIGIPEALGEVKQYVDFLGNPSKFTRLGARLPKGCLLTGEPGTGKTLLAKAVAGEANVPFFTCSGADFIEVYAGSGPRRVRELFLEAREAAPSVIFIDEIDAIGSRSGNNRPSAGGVSGEENRTINQILSELDGLATTDDSVIVFAATNFPENLDKAIVREGRFDRKVELPMPDAAAREDLFSHYLRRVVTGDPSSKKQGEASATPAAAAAAASAAGSIVAQPTAASAAPEGKSTTTQSTTTTSATAMSAAEADTKNATLAKELACLTPGVSPAAISTIVNEAALAAAVNGEAHVTAPYLRAAIDDVLIGRRHRQRMTSEAASRVALHEAGHALVAWLLPQQRPVIKLSITPRGGVAGFTQQLGREPGDHMTDTSLFADICVMLGGRAAENTRHTDLSTGAQDDLRRATDVALKEILAFGMSQRGDGMLLAFDFNRLDSGRMYQKFTQTLQEEAEKEATALVAEAMRCTVELLGKNTKQLMQLHDELLEKTELLPGDLERILGKRPADAGSWASSVHEAQRAALDRMRRQFAATTTAKDSAAPKPALG